MVALMEEKNIDWSNIGFGYHKTEKRYVSNYKDGKWDAGSITEDANIVLNESAGVLQYAQTCFEGMKAYRTVDGKVVVFRPDLNAKRMADTAKRLEMPVFPEERFVEAVKEVVKANLKYVPPYETGATLYLRPFMFGSAPKYNQLIPAESPKQAVVKVSQLIAALERVSVMVNDKTSIVKMLFADNELTLSADTPDAGKSEDKIDIQYTAEELLIAFNYKFVLDALRIIESEEVIIGLNASLSATVLKPNSEEDFICLIMPVQIR